MSVPKIFVPVLAGLVLIGCAGSDQPPRQCPPAGTPSPLDRVTAFRDTAGRDLTDVLYEARLDGVDAACEYDKDGVAIDLLVRIIAERGPADRERRALVRYFVAVEDGPRNVVAKQIYEIQMPFEGNNRRAGRVEELTVTVPAPENRSFADLRIQVGLQLTAEQLEFNRNQIPR